MAITFSITGGADAAKFTINATSGVLAFITAPNFELPTDANGDNVYEVTVRATDSQGLFDAKTVLVTVTDVAEGGALPPLTNSGSITVTSNNQVIENRNITGRVTIGAFTGVTVRNCIIRHAADVGLLATNSVNLTLQDLEFINTSSPSGQTPTSGEVKNMELSRTSGTTLLERIKVTGGCGLYGYIIGGTLIVRFLEGHNVRGMATSPYRGNLFQLNQCTATTTVEDFSVENDINNSWPEDSCSVHYCTGAMTFRRGYLKGQSSPTGVAFMVEHTNGVIVEDVDCENHFNGAFSVYDTSANVTYRRCRAKNQLLTNQGRGNPTSNYCNFVSAPGVTGTRFEQVKYWNISSNLAWQTPFTVMDWAPLNFTPRAPIRNRTPGT